MKMVREK
jgi:hypothetical protein